MSPDPLKVTLPRVHIRNVRSTSRTDSAGGYADITIRVGLGESYMKALPFLEWCQENGTPIDLELSQVQLPFEQPPEQEALPAEPTAEAE